MDLREAEPPALRGACPRSSSATTTGLHVPCAVARSDEAILGSDRGVAKDFGVVNRINAIKAAGHDVTCSVAAVADVVLRGCGGSDRNAEYCDADQNDEIHFSNHGDLLCCLSQHRSLPGLRRAGFLPRRAALRWSRAKVHLRAKKEAARLGSARVAAIVKPIPP